jgi:hypothetical protein
MKAQNKEVHIAGRFLNLSVRNRKSGSFCGPRRQGEYLEQPW